MKRTMKKALSLIMAIAMAMSLVVVAQAAAPNVTATPATNTVGITGATFAWGGSLADDEKTDFTDALTSVGKDLSFDTTASAIEYASGLPDGYSVAESDGVTVASGSAAFTIKQSSTTIGTLTLTVGTLAAGSATIKLKPAATTTTTTSGDEVTDEDDADNSDSAISGGGFYEGYVDQEVFRVVLPAVTASALAFTIDPQGLIAATANTYAAANTRYEGKKFTEEGSMFFLNTTNKATISGDTQADYSPNSDHFKVVNKGACDVDVEIVVSAIGTALSGDEPTLSFVNSGGAFGDSTDHSLYIGLSSKVSTASGDPTVAAIAKDGSDYKATATGTVEKTDDVYEYTYSGGEYAYSLKDDATGFNEFEFWLSGAANTNATDNWGLTTGSIGLSLTWKITKVSDDDEGGGSSGPKATATAGAVSSGTTIPISVTNATGYTVTGIYWSNGGTRTDFPASRVNIGEMSDEGACTVTLTANSAFANSSETKVYVVLEKDGEETPLEVTVRA